jgi:hypothetical protein
MANVNGIAGAQRDWDLYRGDTWQYDFQLQGSDGAILDLSGAVITGVVKLKNDDLAPNEISLSTAPGGGITLDVDNKTVKVFKKMDVVKKSTVYYYSFKVVFPNNLVVTPRFGILNFTQNDQ